MRQVLAWAVGRGPSRALADGLLGRAIALFNMGQVAEAAGEARQALAMAREIGYPAGRCWPWATSASPPVTAMTWTAGCSSPGPPRRPAA